MCNLQLCNVGKCTDRVRIGVSRYHIFSLNSNLCNICDNPVVVLLSAASGQVCASVNMRFTIQTLSFLILSPTSISVDMQDTRLEWGRRDSHFCLLQEVAEHINGCSYQAVCIFKEKTVRNIMKYIGYVYKAAKVKMMHFRTYHRMQTKLGMMINKKILIPTFCCILAGGSSVKPQVSTPITLKLLLPKKHQYSHCLNDPSQATVTRHQAAETLEFTMQGRFIYIRPC